MSILKRFKDIMSSNINALLDKAEDPEKMIDQYLRNLNKDLREVKSETATIMADEKRAKRELQECQSEVNKMETYAMKALEAGNEDDARKFLERKQQVETKLAELQKTAEIAQANTTQMRQMHDKLVNDVQELESRRAMLKGKAAVAKTQARMNEIGASAKNANASISDFDRLEQKINQSLDEANAMAELNQGDSNDVENLTAKYDQTNNDVENELAALKAKMAEKDE
ncbi:PspA/IM30 family protein [Pseudogracilibacillus sp. ICA-222130]|uniref:PspA/IM30 family protein n=1 Tax=Pseudogracilibacillus sp. ICA-222130 TaxID=3134655 RepID=UPI0030C5719E